MGAPPLEDDVDFQREGGGSVEHGPERFGALEDGADLVNDLPLSVVAEECIVAPILSQYRCLSSLTLHIVTVELDLHAHATALRKYLLHGAGDFASALVGGLCSAAGRMDVHPILPAVLQEAIRGTSCEADPHVEHLSLVVAAAAAAEGRAALLDEHALDGLTQVELQYDVRWPISTVITPKVVECHTTANKLLTHLNQAELALQETWARLRTAEKAARRGDVAVVERLRRLALLHQELAHFVRSAHAHVAEEMEVAWSRLQARLARGTPPDLRALRHQYETYAHEVVQRCLALPATATARAALDEGLQHVLDLRHALRLKRVGADGEPPSKRLARSAQELHHSFQRECRTLVTALHELGAADATHAAGLAARLDFNGFLARKTVWGISAAACRA